MVTSGSKKPRWLRLKLEASKGRPQTTGWRHNATSVMYTVYAVNRTYISRRHVCCFQILGPFHSPSVKLSNDDVFKASGPKEFWKWRKVLVSTLCTGVTELSWFGQLLAGRSQWLVLQMMLWWYLVHTFITLCCPDLRVQLCIFSLSLLTGSFTSDASVLPHFCLRNYTVITA